MKMDKEQITALAREYAEEHVEQYGFSRSTYEELIEEKTEQVGNILRWMLRNFCIVEKDAVRKEYREATSHVTEAIKNKSPLSESCGKGKRLAIKSLFPEIGKEEG